MLQGYLRFDARLLAAGGEREANLPGDLDVPAAEEPRLRAHILILNVWQGRGAHGLRRLPRVPG